MIPAFATAFAALVALALAADPGAQISAARARRAAEQSAVRALAVRESSVLGLLDDAQRARGEAEEAAARALADRARSIAALQKAADEEARAAARLEGVLAALRPRLAARVRMGRTGGLRFLLASGSASDFARRRHALERILARDAALLVEARATRALLAEAHRTSEAEAARADELAREATRRTAEAVAQAEAQRTLLAAVRVERRIHERAAALAAAQERKLAALVASLSPAAPGPRFATASHGFAALRGRLPRPVDGPVVAPFGRVIDPRFHTMTSHPGVDLRAARGTPVRAVAGGRVVHAGWFRGYGNLVIVDHGDGFHSLVAHLGSMSTAVGEEVSAGSVLGHVGDAADLGGEAVYFEIRERQKPVDPAGWLAPAPGDTLGR